MKPRKIQNDGRLGKKRRLRSRAVAAFEEVFLIYTVGDSDNDLLEDLPIYYQSLRRLANEFELATWKVELILLHSINVAFDYNVGSPIVLVDNVINLRYKEAVKLLSRWAGRFSEFEELLLKRKICADSRWTNTTYFDQED